jgi:Protein of unknown function (DUF3800)
MRYIYTDEAGTSAREPVCVVAAVIVDADNQWRDLDLAIKSAIHEWVPESIRDNFYIHATEIFSGGKTVKRDEWPLESRLSFLKTILSIPRLYDVPIAIGKIVKAERSFPISEEDMKKFGINHNGMCHLTAFVDCMEKADYFLRHYLGGKEIGSVVAEEIGALKNIFTDVGLVYRETPLELESKDFRQAEWMRELGIAPPAYQYRIDCIVDVPHFVSKRGAPLLQLADVCAFAFRRFMVGKSHGEEMILAMLGDQAGANVIADEIWRTSGSGLFNTYAYWSDEQKSQRQHTAMALKVVRGLAALPPKQ